MTDRVCEVIGVGFGEFLDAVSVDSHNGVEFFLGEVKTREVHVFVGRNVTERRILRSGGAFDAADHPCEDASVVAVARPHELAFRRLAEPVDVEHCRRLGDFRHGQVVREVVAHVVTAEREHRERVAAESADLTFSSSRLFGTDRGAEVDTVCPVVCLEHERDVVHAATAINEDVNRDAFRALPIRVDARAVSSRSSEAGVRVRGEFALAGLFVDHVRGPVVALPVDEVCRRFLRHAFPPDVAVVRESDVREDGVLGAGEERVRIRVHSRSRSNAEEAVFRIDGAELAGCVRLDPCDVVTDAGDFPALFAKFLRRDEHCKVRLTASRRECSRDVVLLAFRGLDTEDEHVLGEPALLAGEIGSDAESKALLAEESISSVAGTERPDRAFFREVDDVGVVRVARPFHVFDARLERHTDGVDARNEEVVLFDVAEHFRGNASHDAHGDDDVRGVRDFNAVLSDRGTERTHRERDDVHRAAFHTAVVKSTHFFLHDNRIFPVVRRTGVFLVLRADQRALFNASNVAGVGTIEVAARTLFFVELNRHTAGDHFSEELVGFFLASVAPLNLSRFAERNEFIHPVDEFLIGGRCFHRFDNLN